MGILKAAKAQIKSTLKDAATGAVAGAKVALASKLASGAKFAASTAQSAQQTAQSHAATIQQSVSDKASAVSANVSSNATQLGDKAKAQAESGKSFAGKVSTKLKSKGNIHELGDRASAAAYLPATKLAQKAKTFAGRNPNDQKSVGGTPGGMPGAGIAGKVSGKIQQLKAAGAQKASLAASKVKVKVGAQ